MFSQNRDQLRQVFFDVWFKRQNGLPLEPLEHVLAGIIQNHPEYHETLAQPERHKERDYSPDSGQSNPFLHMAMHLTIHEQLLSDRPAGIVDIHRRLCRQYNDVHVAEHRIMECLAEILWQAQRDGGMPDEKRYLENLRKVLT